MASSERPRLAVVAGEPEESERRDKDRLHWKDQVLFPVEILFAEAAVLSVTIFPRTYFSQEQVDAKV